MKENFENVVRDLNKQIFLDTITLTQSFERQFSEHSIK